MKKSNRSMVAFAFLATSIFSAAAMAESSIGNIVIGSNYQPYGNTCNSNHVTKQAWCNGDYCNYNILHCDTPPYTLSGGQYSMLYSTSDEYYTSDPTRGVCPNGHAFVGMVAGGKYSDNITSYCQAVNMPSISPCWWVQGESFYVSDETGSTEYQQWFLSGFRCNGNYCDNMNYRYQGYYCP